jgi:transcriptional regulator with XRE-family HTH domain
MLRSNVPRAVRHLRQRRRWRQSDLGARACLSRETISRVERGELRGVPIGTLERITDALGASIDLSVRWQGERLDRLADAVHASVQQHVAAVLRSAGWLVAVEVSFNHYGDADGSTSSRGTRQPERRSWWRSRQHSATCRTRSAGST